jgi:hypothetical protein
MVHTRREGCGFVLGCLVFGCSEGRELETPKTVSGDAWVAVPGNYPFLGEHGDNVCAEWRMQSPGTQEWEVERESYWFGRMNEILAGTETVDDPEAIAAIRTSIPEVRTCEDARNFTRLRREFDEAHPRTIEPPFELDTVVDNEEFDALPEPVIARVAESRNFLSKPTVRLNGGACSAVLIGPSALLTAAHCLPNINAFQTLQITVDYGFRDGAWTPCINSDDCSTTTASGFPFPGYTGVGDAPRDLALIVSNVPWKAPANTADSWARLLARAPVVGEQFWIEGYGWNANSGGSPGTERRSLQFETVESMGTRHWIARVTQGRGRGCKHDSGGPANNDHYLIGKPGNFAATAFGVFTYAPQHPYCPDLGETLTYTQISDKLTWVEPFIAGGCYHGSSNNNPYWRCWH